MRVVVPTAGAAPHVGLVELAIRQQGVVPDVVHLDSDDGYHVLLSDEWHRGKPFIVVEHDVIVWPGLLWQMYRCTRPWCTVPMLIGGGWHSETFGCVKFDPTRLTWPHMVPRWQSLDRQFAQAQREWGKTPHLHTPGVTHLGERHQPTGSVSNVVTAIRINDNGYPQRHSTNLWEAS